MYIRDISGEIKRIDQSRSVNLHQKACSKNYKIIPRNSGDYYCFVIPAKAPEDSPLEYRNLPIIKKVLKKIQ